jgi:hypothetical protein
LQVTMLPIQMGVLIGFTVVGGLMFYDEYSTGDGCASPQYTAQCALLCAMPSTLFIAAYSDRQTVNSARRENPVLI